MDKISWVYDIVKKPSGEIIALNYHEAPISAVESCLDWDKTELAMEGLILSMSDTFDTLAEAKASAWKVKDRFSQGLD